jgi:1,4-dihydroxy-2-naphthoate octaprenyltransferase
VLGQALAYAVTGSFSWRAAALVHLFGLLDHLYIVFANDYADREVDADNDTYTLYSGGSRVLVEGRIEPTSLRRAAFAMAGGMVALGLGWSMERPFFVLLAVMAIALLWAYSYPPLRLSYRGGGEVLQGLGLGVVLPMVGYYGQAGSLAQFPWAVLVPLWVLGFAGNIVTALPDEPSDRRGDKRTWPVVRGSAVARRHAVVLIAFGAILTSFVGPPLGTGAKLTVVGLPLAALLGSLAFIGRAEPERRRPMLAFVTLLGGAISLVWVAWSVALFLR